MERLMNTEDILARIVRIVAREGGYVAAVRCALVCRAWRDAVAALMQEGSMRKMRRSFWLFHGVPAVDFEVDVHYKLQSLTRVSWLCRRSMFLIADKMKGVSIWSVQDGASPSMLAQPAETTSYEEVAVAGKSGDFTVSFLSRRFDRTAPSRLVLCLYKAENSWEAPARADFRFSGPDLFSHVGAHDISEDGRLIVAVLYPAFEMGGFQLLLLDRSLQPLSSIDTPHPGGRCPMYPDLAVTLDSTATLAMMTMEKWKKLSHLWNGDPSVAKVYALHPPERIEDVTDDFFSCDDRACVPMEMTFLRRTSSGHYFWTSLDMDDHPHLAPAVNASFQKYLRPWARANRPWWEHPRALGFGIYAKGADSSLYMFASDEQRSVRINHLPRDREREANSLDILVADVSDNWILTANLSWIRAYKMRPDHARLASMLDERPG